MKRVFSVLLASATLSVLLSGCGCNHSWKQATCTSPEECVKCGVTNGNPRGHAWNDKGVCVYCNEFDSSVTASDTLDDSVSENKDEITLTEPIIEVPKFQIKGFQQESETFCAGFFNTIGVNTDGTLQMAGGWVGGNAYKWTDIVSVSFQYRHIVGLKADGTVLAGMDNEYGQCNTSEWTDIIAISAGDGHTVGLKSDSTVVAVGDNLYGQCDVSQWTDIVAISTGGWYTAGLKSNGTVVVVGDFSYDYEVASWTDIVAITSSYNGLFGLKSDGTVVNAHYDDLGQNWSEIVAIDAGWGHLVGIKSNGTVVAEGWSDEGQCVTSGWRNIVAISAGAYHTVGMKADGTMVCTYIYDDERDYGQGNARYWTDILTDNPRNDISSEVIIN